MYSVLSLQVNCKCSLQMKEPIILYYTQGSCFLAMNITETYRSSL